MRTCFLAIRSCRAGGGTNNESGAVMTTNAELRAAARRVRSIRTGVEKSQDIYGVTVGEGREAIHEAFLKVKRMMLDDERMLVDFAVATVPADDDEPLTVESLRQQLADVTAECRRLEHDVEVANAHRRIAEQQLDRLRAELLQQPPTLEWLLGMFGEPDKPGAIVSWWGERLSWNINGQCNVGPYYQCETMKTRAAVLEAVAATKGVAC